MPEIDAPKFLARASCRLCSDRIWSLPTRSGRLKSYAVTREPLPATEATEAAAVGLCSLENLGGSGLTKNGSSFFSDESFTRLELPKSALVIRPATVEAVVLPPIDTSDWTRETLDAEIQAIRERYLEVLEG